MFEAKYKSKIEAMQIYVPLLEKLIAKIQAKNNQNEENLEKISQLKKLLQQLRDPKPGISFEELDECHLVMENLFLTNIKQKEQRTQNQEEGRLLKVQTAQIADNLMKSSIDILNDIKENRKTNNLEEPIDLNNVAEKDLKESDKENTEQEQNIDYKFRSAISKDILNANIESNEQNDNGINSSDGSENENENKNATLTTTEPEKVELIEFSADENDENFEDEEELILPDNEYKEVIESKLSTKEIAKNCVKNVKNGSSCKASTGNEPKNLEENKSLVESFNLEKATLKKRPNISLVNLKELTEAKKIKIWDPKTNSDKINELKNNENCLDPLEVEAVCIEKCSNIANEKQSIDKNNEEQNEFSNPNENETKGTTVAASEANDDDDDDIQIIENHHSPILIDSDDGDSYDDKMRYDKSEKNNFISAPQLSVSKSNDKTNRLSLPSSSLSLKQNLSVNLKCVFATKKAKHLHNKLQSQLEQKCTKQLKRPSTKSGTVKKSSNTTDNLQPKMISGPNPQLFSTKIGDRNLLIPNAFYGANKTSTIQNQSQCQNSSDIAHCRWLDNFLRHFCSPYNIAHNTCFLLLQRALRANDFLAIQERRSCLNVTHGNIDEELMQTLCKIFYINGDSVASKLTFIGRKFCNLAFVNILDKTISLTVDWRTNAVTSRTRILTATLEAVRKDNPVQTQTNSTVTFPTAIVYPKNTTSATNSIASINLTPSSSTFETSLNSTNCVTIPTDIPATIIHMPKQSTQKHLKNTVNDEDSNKKLFNQSSAETVTLHRSSRNVKQNENVENANRFVYSSDENNDDSGDDVELLLKNKNNKSTLNVHREVDVSAALQDIISQQHIPLENTTRPKQKTTTYEMAFLECLANEDKDSNVRTQNIRKTSKPLSNICETIILDDDDDDNANQSRAAKHIGPVAAQTATSTIKLPLEPRLVKLNQAKTHEKNINSKIHFKGKANDSCIICSKHVKHIVAHYVNMHPEYEVYVSRPSPKYVDLLKRKKMPFAEFDRLRNSYPMYLSTCAFCEKKASFTMSYWHQHFASHTGEYAFKCSGCGIRKPTRSHLILHLRVCAQKGSNVVNISKDQYDGFSPQISAYMCNICNYTQMSSEKILKHLRNEHEIERQGKELVIKVDLIVAGEQSKKIQKLAPKPLPSHNYSNTAKPPIIIRNSNGDILEVAENDNGKSFALDLTASVDPTPLVVNEAELYGSENSNLDEIGDIECVLQAYVNIKEY